MSESHDSLFCYPNVRTGSLNAESISKGC
jgi:hypothetical protein